LGGTWETQKLPERPDAVSPSGGSEIRNLPAFDEGSLAHARAVQGHPAAPATLVGAGELFYVLAGEGELWRGTGDLEDVTPLQPGRCVSIPPGIAFQYRALTSQLDFIVATVPRWRPRNWTAAQARYWDEQGAAPADRPLRPGPWLTADLRDEYDDLAPDGLEIRLLLSYDAGGLAHRRLPAGQASRPVRHRTIVEVWFVLSGRGEVWRSDGENEETVEIEPAVCLTIPTRTSFQFRAAPDEPLDILLGTFPKWPGPMEAEDVSGRWA
jgi:mannose-6-phosphate isomerase-like protein (cupin superfamily)